MLDHYGSVSFLLDINRNRAISFGILFVREHSMATIETADLKTIHKTYQEVDKKPKYSKIYLYFLATCFYRDTDLDLHIALCLRPYGRAIGIGNSNLDKYFNLCKI